MRPPASRTSESSGFADTSDVSREATVAKMLPRGQGPNGGGRGPGGGYQPRDRFVAVQWCGPRRPGCGCNRQRAAPAPAQQGCVFPGWTGSLFERQSRSRVARRGLESSADPSPARPLAERPSDQGARGQLARRVWGIRHWWLIAVAAIWPSASAVSGQAAATLRTGVAAGGVRGLADVRVGKSLDRKASNRLGSRGTTGGPIRRMR